MYNMQDTIELELKHTVNKIYGSRILANGTKILHSKKQVKQLVLKLGFAATLCGLELSNKQYGLLHITRVVSVLVSEILFLMMYLALKVSTLLARNAASHQNLLGLADNFTLQIQYPQSRKPRADIMVVTLPFMFTTYNGII